MSKAQEYMTNFQESAAAVLAAAVTQELSKGNPEAFKEKPLNCLQLVMERANAHDPRGVKTERLTIAPIIASPEIVSLPQHGQLVRMGRIAIGDDVSVTQWLTPETVNAQYVAELKGNRTAHFNSGALPPPQTGKRGANFAEECLNFARSDSFLKSPPRGSEIFPGQIIGKLTFQMLHDLPLNGHEPLEFLQTYARTMANNAQVQQLEWLRLTRAYAPAHLIAASTQNLEAYLDATARAASLMHAKYGLTSSM